MDTITTAVEAALGFVTHVGAIIAVHDRIPSGHVYARVQERMTLEQFERTLKVLEAIGYIKRDGFMLLWTGPTDLLKNSAA